MTDWEGLLTEVTASVQKACASVGSGGAWAEVVGKGAAGDMTLVADREAERMIIDALLSVQGVRILSEEAGEVGPKSSRYLAIVDPLDGSSNFSRSIPFYCTSICIVEGERLRDAKYAAVRNLVNGDIYYAERNGGAFKNKGKVHPSRTGELSGAVAAVDISKATADVVRGLNPLLSKIARQVHFGANALELCMVADGIVDAFVDMRNRMRITDLAGAYLIAKEAGVPLSSGAGEELDPSLDLEVKVRVVAAANSELQRRILNELGSFRGRRH
jgi:myo-inositol-1(or 4)-monophosphatase